MNSCGDSSSKKKKRSPKKVSFDEEINLADELIENDHQDDTAKVQKSLKLKSTFFNGFKAILKRLFTWSRSDVLDDSETTFLVEYLETLFDISMMPYYVSKYFYNHPKAVKMIKIVGKIILETVIWHFIAGVSILTGIILIVEDHYYLKHNYHESDETISNEYRNEEEISKPLKEN